MTEPERSLVRLEEDAAIVTRLCEVTPVALAFRGEPTFEEWQAVGKRLEQLIHAVQWWWGDYVLLGEARFGEKAAQAMSATRWGYQHFANLIWVAKRLPVSSREEKLSWHHHQLVAPDKYNPEEQVYWLEQAVEHNWSVAEMREAMRAERPMPSLPPGRYATVEADPPWELDLAEAKSAAPQYPLLDTDSLKDMAGGIADLCAPDCHLYLWAINPMLPEALEVLEAWGFQYKTCITWAKPSFGTGHYYRGATEHCLFGVRGSLPTLRADQSNWFEAPRVGRHSAKPPRFYEIVEGMSPAPRVRLFARDQREGWTSWGNEVPDAEKP